MKVSRFLVFTGGRRSPPAVMAAPTLLISKFSSTVTSPSR
jgi:hypothetical protein